MVAGTGSLRPAAFSHDRSRSYSALPDVAPSPTHLFADSIYELEVLRLDSTSEAAHDDRLVADALDLGILAAEIPIAIRDHSFGTPSTPSDRSFISAHSGLTSVGSTALTSVSSRPSRDQPPRKAAHLANARQSMASATSDPPDGVRRSTSTASASRTTTPVRRSLSILRRRGSNVSRATTVADEPLDDPGVRIERHGPLNPKTALGRIFSRRGSFSSTRNAHLKRRSYSAPGSGQNSPTGTAAPSPSLRPMAPVREDPRSVSPVRLHARSSSTPLLHTLVMSNPTLLTIHNSTQIQLRRFQTFHQQQRSTLQRYRTLALRAILHTHIRGLVPMREKHVTRLLALEDRHLEEEVRLDEELETRSTSLEKTLRWRRDFVASGRNVSDEERMRLRQTEREWADLDTNNRKTINRLRMKQERARENLVQSQREEVAALEKRMRDEVAGALQSYRAHDLRLTELFEARRKRVNGRWELEVMMWARLDGNDDIEGLGQLCALKWPEPLGRAKRAA